LVTGAFYLHFAAVHKLTGKPNSLYDAADGDEDSKFLLNYATVV